MHSYHVLDRQSDWLKAAASANIASMPTANIPSHGPSRLCMRFRQLVTEASVLHLCQLSVFTTRMELPQALEHLRIFFLLERASLQDLLTFRIGS